MVFHDVLGYSLCCSGESEGDLVATRVGAMAVGGNALQTSDDCVATLNHPTSFAFCTAIAALRAHTGG